MELRITLKAARVNRGLSQKSAAEEIGVDRTTLQNYEKGKTIPNWAVAKRIQEVYGIPLDYIIFGRESA